MRIFKKGNWSCGAKCPICSTNKEGEVTLVGLEGTEDGYNVQALQVHIECLELTFKKGIEDTRDIIYQIVKETK